jgi:hypothetical protein
MNTAGHRLHPCPHQRTDEETTRKIHMDYSTAFPGYAPISYQLQTGWILPTLEDLYQLLHGQIRLLLNGIDEADLTLL